jgi:hypothetical protein
MLTIAVPAEELAGAREILATLEQIKLESARAAERGDVEADHVRELAEQLDRPGEPAELTGPAALVRDMVYGLLLDGADALAEACRRYEAGEIALDALARAGASARRRLGMFVELERVDGEAEG